MTAAIHGIPATAAASGTHAPAAIPRGIATAPGSSTTRARPPRSAPPGSQGARGSLFGVIVAGAALVSARTSDRPAEAFAALQPAPRGPVDGANTYVSHTELHARLADAWRAARRGSAA